MRRSKRGWFTKDNSKEIEKQGGQNNEREIEYKRRGTKFWKTNNSTKKHMYTIYFHSSLPLFSGLLPSICIHQPCDKLLHTKMRLIILCLSPSLRIDISPCIFSLSQNKMIKTSDLSQHFYLLRVDVGSLISLICWSKLQKICLALFYFQHSHFLE